MQVESGMRGFKMDVNNSDDFVELMTSFQGKYLTFLLWRSHTANDILQKTNLVLWRNQPSIKWVQILKPGLLGSLIFVMAYRQRIMRDRLVLMMILCLRLL